MSLVKHALAGLAAGGIYMSLPKADDGQAFAQPMSVAVERLESKRRLVEGTGLGSLTIASEGTSRGALLIGVRRAGDARGVTCRVAVSATSLETSRADIDCAQPVGPDQPMRNLGAEAIALVVREHVAATVERRAYDIDGVANGMLLLLVTNRPTIADSIASDHD